MNDMYSAEILSDTIEFSGLQEKTIDLNPEDSEYVEFLFDNQGETDITLKLRMNIRNIAKVKNIVLKADASLSIIQTNIIGVKVSSENGKLFYILQGYMR